MPRAAWPAASSSARERPSGFIRGSTGPSWDRHAHFFHQYLQIFPGILLGGRGPQQVGRVVRDEGLDSPAAVPAAAKLAQGRGGRDVQQGRSGGPTEQAEEFRPDDGDLVLKAVERVQTHRQKLAATSEAIKALEESKFAREALGADVVEHYLHFFRTEQRKFDATVTDWERRRYFEQA